mgnify:FL=1
MLKMKRILTMLNSIIILLLSFFSGCETPAGHSGVSRDITDSKRRGVFISEYFVNPNPYKINDTLKITIKEAWLEKQWTYGKHEDQTLLFQPENYQLCINTTEEDIKTMNSNWTIGLNGDKYMRMSSLNSLLGDFQTIPGDTIEYKVQQGMELSDNYKKNIIGKLILVKKREN